jgi:prevent-host-death family protein
MSLPTWPVQDAKARFSELLEACVAQGPQMVTKRGAEAAVLVPVAQWRRMQSVARPSLKALLMSDEGRGELVLPERGVGPYRPAVAWE